MKKKKNLKMKLMEKRKPMQRKACFIICGKLFLAANKNRISQREKR